MLRQRIQCIRSLNVGSSDFPGVPGMSWIAAGDQDVRENYARSLIGQAGTSGRLEAVHLVSARRLRCPDVNKSPIDVHQIEFDCPHAHAAPLHQLN